VKKQPNIVCIISDDTDHSYLGFSGGGKNVLTPRLDQMAAEGAVFKRAYCCGAVCTASRYSYLTGLYPGRCDGEDFMAEFPIDDLYSQQWNAYIDRPEDCLGQIFSQAGYRTGYVGKMHAGRHAPNLGINVFEQPEDADPADPEFARVLQSNHEKMVAEMSRLGFEYANSMYWNNADINRAKKMHVHNIEWITQGALEFLDAGRDDDRPFLLYMATTTIHGPDHRESLDGDPRITSKGLLDEVPDVMPPRHTVRERLRAAGLPYTHDEAGALWMDDAVGAVLDKLDAMGVSGDTLVIYHVDHNVIGKTTCYEKGVHIPMAVKWPGNIAPGTEIDGRVHNVDMLPTLLDICGIEPPKTFDGASFLPLLKNEAEEIHDDLYFEIGTFRGVSTKKWKYIELRYRRPDIERMESGELDVALDCYGGAPCMAAKTGVYHYPAYFDPDQLYDLENDPDEQNNLANDPACAEVLADMRRRLRKHLDSFAHYWPDGPQPFQQTGTYRELARHRRETETLANWWKSERAPW
jgi:arylsulfatase A-like enzyme